jgi:hypothetical protein
MSETANPLETDPRFPSGRWVGFWIQKHCSPGRFETELLLTFAQGVLTGEGRDRVGEYTVRGHYSLADGRCHWTKSYLGRHDVFYEGFNEGKGIWGTWTIPVGDASHVELRGGFHIWPEGMLDPTGSRLFEEADPPIVLEEIEVAEPVPAPGAGSGL